MNLIEIAQAETHEVTPELIHTQEETHTEVGHETGAHEEEGLLASLGINGTLFTFQLINFAVVSLILWFLILKPLTSKLTERQKKIDESLDNAERVEENLKKSEKNYQTKIDEAKVEANRIVEKSAIEAEKVGNVMKEKAKVEIEIIVKQAKKNIEMEKVEVMEGLKKETADLIVTALEKILEAKMDGKKDAELIEGVLKKLHPVK